MFLYILSIKKYNSLKIGIASGISRVISHMRTYENIELDKSYMVTAKDDHTIKRLERQLLSDYIEHKINDERLKDRDGYTELRDISTMNDIVEDIEYKMNKFPNKEINIQKGIVINVNNNTNHQSNKKRTVNLKPHREIHEKYEDKNKQMMLRILEILSNIEMKITDYKIDNNGIITKITFEGNNNDFIYELDQLIFKTPYSSSPFTVGSKCSSLRSDDGWEWYCEKVDINYNKDEDFKKHFDSIHEKLWNMIKTQDDSRFVNFKENSERFWEIKNENKDKIPSGQFGLDWFNAMIQD